MAIIIIKMRTPNKYLEISGVSEALPFFLAPKDITT